MAGLSAVYGWPPPGLAQAAPGAIQLSPFDPRGAGLEGLAAGSLESVVIAAPPGAIERRFILAHALRALEAGGALTALAPKNRGGTRLAGELRAFGCEPSENARRHQRIASCRRPSSPHGLDAAIAAGALQLVPALGLWSQPGVFSWERIDAGSAVLLASGLSFTGRGADIGCGIGILARDVLARGAVESLALIDIDGRAIAAARRNVIDSRTVFAHADIREPSALAGGLDFVVMNPAFHHEGREDRGLGGQFIAAAAGALRKGGVCRMVANVALPYEAVLARAFAKVAQVGRGRGYKVLEAIR